MNPSIVARLAGKYRLIRQELRTLIRRTTCRYVSYGVAVYVTRRMIDNPVGLLLARRRSSRLLQYLSDSGIECDTRDVVVRSRMLKTLFPWGYCRLIRCSNAEFDAWVRMSGFDAVEPFLGSNSGVLLINCHFGPGHMAKYALGAKGYVINNLLARNTFARHYRISPERDCRMSRAMYIRDDSSMGFLRTTTTIRDFLRRGENVAYAVDGKQGYGEGVNIEFMGEPLVIRIALPLVAALTKSKIVPMFVTLEKDGRINIRFENAYRDRREDEPPRAYAEMVVRDYMEKVQAFCKSEPSHIKLSRVGAEQER